LEKSALTHPSLLDESIAQKKLTQRRKDAKKTAKLLSVACCSRAFLCAFAPLRETLFLFSTVYCDQVCHTLHGKRNGDFGFQISEFSFMI
jgi:hypothetical protein